MGKRGGGGRGGGGGGGGEMFGREREMESRWSGPMYKVSASLLMSTQTLPF